MGAWVGGWLGVSWTLEEGLAGWLAGWWGLDSWGLTEEGLGVRIRVSEGGRAEIFLVPLASAGFVQLFPRDTRFPQK